MRGISKVCGIAAVLLSATGARAEIVEITGEFPAAYREASFLESVHVGRLGGQDGPALALAIERALTNTQFAVIGGRAGRDTAEGELSGVVTTGVDESRYSKKEKKCVEKDADKKCIREEQVDVPCRRRVINLTADLRLVRNGDGRILYSRAYPFRDEISWCEGGSPGRTIEDTVSGAIRNVAQGVRSDIAPSVETYRIRLRESTKGMDKDMAKAFKALIKSSQRNLADACGQWTAMNQAAPGNPSLTYNLGLCAEQRGDYQAALALFQDASRAGASEGRTSAERAERLIAGKQDAAERAKRRRR